MEKQNVTMSCKQQLFEEAEYVEAIEYGRLLETNPSFCSFRFLSEGKERSVTIQKKQATFQFMQADDDTKTIMTLSKETQGTLELRSGPYQLRFITECENIEIQPNRIFFQYQLKDENGENRISKNTIEIQSEVQLWSISKQN